MEKETKNDKLLERLTLSQKVDYTLLEGKLGIFLFCKKNRRIYSSHKRTFRRRYPSKRNDFCESL